MHSLHFLKVSFPINIFHLFGRGRPFRPLNHDDKVLIKRLTSCIWERLISQGPELFRGQSALRVSAIAMVTSPSPAGERSPLLPTDSLAPAFLWLLSAKVRHSARHGQSCTFFNKWITGNFDHKKVLWPLMGFRDPGESALGLFSSWWDPYPLE